MVRRRPVGPCLAILLLAAAPAAAPAAQTILLDFTSPTCGPCRRMRPKIQQLIAAGYAVREVDVTREPQLAQRFRVTSVPTFIVLVDEEPRARLTGSTSYEQLVAMIAKSQQIAVRGQSPQGVALQPGRAPATFADPNADLQTPQAGRIVELEPPGGYESAPRPAPAASTPGFNGAPAATGATAAPAGAYADPNKLTAATVRLVVDDPTGRSTGTGTIVDARSGQALVLTCGHIFRESQGKGRIEVTLFDAGPQGPVQRGVVEGTLLDYDLQRDLALVSIWIDAPVTVAPIAPATAAARPTEPVTTMGCSGGADPTAQQTRVSSVNRYTGPPNVEVQGAPVEGRSGGGLFNAAGQVVGVCFASDPGSDEGLYAGLPSIHAKLDEQRLSVVYQQPSIDGSSASAATAAPAATQIRGQDPAASFASTQPAPTTPLTVPPTPGIGAAAAATNPFSAEPSAETPATSPPQTLSTVEQATLEELARRAGGSEVICIIRPQTPGGKSEVITVSGASPAFVGALEQAAAAGTTRR